MCSMFVLITRNLYFWCMSFILPGCCGTRKVSSNNPRQWDIFCFAALKTQNMPLLGSVRHLEERHGYPAACCNRNRWSRRLFGAGQRQQWLTRISLPAIQILTVEGGAILLWGPRPSGRGLWDCLFESSGG